MSTAPEADVAAPASPLPRLKGLLSAIFRRGAWAVTDQAVASIGNFTRNVVLAYFLAEEVFGAFGMLLSAFLFLSSLHAAGVIYPIQVKGSVLDKGRIASFATMSMVLTLAVAIPLVAAMGLSAAWMVEHAQTGGVEISTTWTAVLSAVGLGAFLMQELFRRTLMARLRFGAAIPGDAMAYLGQVVVIYVVGKAGWLEGPMALPRALGVMAAASAVGAMIQAFQVGLARFEWGDARRYVGEFWSLGKWLLAANLTALVTDIGYNWMLGLLHSTGVAGHYRVITDMNKVANPVVLTLAGLIVPVVARARASSNLATAKRVGLKYAAVGAVTLGGYMLILLAIPDLLLRIVYPEQFAHLGNGVRVFAITSFIGFSATMCLAVLNGLGRPHVQFMAAMTNTVATLVVGLPLTWYYGLWGALWGGLAATVALTAVTVIMFLRTR